MIDLVAQEKLPKVSTELPLTPMIDVVFLLLIFFVSIQFKRMADILEAQLPEEPGVVNRLDARERLIDRHIRVTVRPAKGWRAEYTQRAKTDAPRHLQDVAVELDYRDLRSDMDVPTDAAVTNDALFETLAHALVTRKQWMKDLGKEPVLVLDLDRRLTFQNVVSTVNAAKRAKFADISFLPPAGDRPNDRD